MAHNLQKKPSKGILKTSTSVDTREGPSTSSESHRRKEQRFDEMNIMETFHPANKDYGHMKIDEPDTPYNEPDEAEFRTGDELDANILAAKLTATMNQPPKCTAEGQRECAEGEPESEEARQRRLDFEKKRKMHYNEFQALQLAKQMMAEDEEDEEAPGPPQK